MTMVLAVMYREFRIRTSSLTWLFYDLFVPLMYLLLFGLGFDRAMGQGFELQGAPVAYNAFFLAGVLSMACFGIAINTSYGLFVDRDNGIFYEFLTYPMTRGEYLIGKILFNSCLSVVQSLLTISLGALLLDIPVVWRLLPLALAGVVLGTAGWFFFLSTFALRIRRNDVFNTVLNVVYFLLMFASSMFYPLDRAPSWLRAISFANPLTWHTDVLRATTIGVGVQSSVAVEAAMFALFLLVSFGFAVRTLKEGAVR
jgi:ABC-type multidrug transport system permease subunit